MSFFEWDEPLVSSNKVVVLYSILSWRYLGSIWKSPEIEYRKYKKMTEFVLDQVDEEVNFNSIRQLKIDPRIFISLSFFSLTSSYRIGFLSTPIIKFVCRPTTRLWVKSFAVQKETNVCGSIVQQNELSFLFGPSSLNYGVFRRCIQTVKINARCLTAAS